MKGLILAGGSGSRLRPITHTSAKQLIPVANKPVIFYGIEQLRDAGVVDLGIVVGDTAAEVRAAIGDGSDLGVRVTYIPQEAPLGLAHAVLIAADFLGDDDFVMLLGDNFLIGGMTEFVADFVAGDADVQLLLTEVAEPQFYGVAVLDEDGRVARLVEKPVDPPSNLAIVGVYMFRPLVHEAVRLIEPGARGELEITDAIELLIAKGANVRSRMVTGYWKDTGRLQDMLECNRRVLETLVARIDGEVDEASRIVGRVVVESGARVVRSTIRGPAIIGHDTVVSDSYIGPFTSVYHDCVVDHTELEHSIVLESSTIKDVSRIEDSLIGKNVQVLRSHEAPRAHRLMVGDHSRVELG